MQAKATAQWSGRNEGVLPTGRRVGDERPLGIPLARRVPANVLRDRSVDVLTPTDLAHRHRAYRHRVMMGPTYRADLWAALEAHPGLSPAELARRTYASFASAWQTKRAFVIFFRPSEKDRARRTGLRELTHMTEEFGGYDAEEKPKRR